MQYVETVEVPIDQPQDYPGNARVHDDEWLDESAETNGQYRAVLARRLDDGTLQLLAGHGTRAAFRRRGDQTIRVEVIEADDREARRINLVDNPRPGIGGFDDSALLALLDSASVDGGLTGTGWDADAYEELLDKVGRDVNENPHDWRPDVDPDEQDVEPPVEPVTKLGDVWVCGEHRVMCGDSTDSASVKALLNGTTLTLLHADPPYGMSKEADGVLNDNLHGVKLDAFQMAWWNTWRPHLAENGSAYIWGTAPDLWRLWYVGGLNSDRRLMIRNEIVWDKGSTPGMSSGVAHSYPVATERCLFLMLGEQFLGNQNQDAYWEGYEPLRSWLDGQVKAAGWTPRDVNRITGSQMASHWLTKSQFMPISERAYGQLAEAAEGRAFTTSYVDLFKGFFPDLRSEGNAYRELAAALRESRSTFDNTHDVMTDVWDFPRVVGEDRKGHATPKPVAMMQRAFRSSSRPGDSIGVPFGGSGPDIVAAHMDGRRAYVMELAPGYVDVIIRRYQDLTGEYPVLEATGEAWDFTATPPCPVPV